MRRGSDTGDEMTYVTNEDDAGDLMLFNIDRSISMLFNQKVHQKVCFYLTFNPDRCPIRFHTIIQTQIFGLKRSIED